MSKTVEQTYTKKTQLEHVLLRPDTYIGSVERLSQPMWVLDSGRLVNRTTSYIPGLYKIFDEILVNAADNKQRDSSMNKLQVDVDPASNTIRVWNNGRGIPIVVHAEHGCYVPELIFGHLLTGSNFDDNEDKTTGGRNGFGAKLTNIFSTEFTVETADSERGLQYKQVFRNNMLVTEKPVIKKFKGADFTCITFKPDLERFKMTCLEADIVALMGKRVYDMAGSNKMGRLAVFLNNERVNIKNFKEYIQLYKGSDSEFHGFEEFIAFETCNERWEIGVGVSDGSFHQISFVNSICSSKGGTHVQFITDQITDRLAAVVKKKNKGVEVKPANVRNHLFVCVNALITNPTFDSQTKDALTTRPNIFSGAKSAEQACTLSDKTLRAIENNATLMDHILRWAKTKQDQELKKKGGSKSTKVLGIPKLDDANNAGTSKSANCTLILTEGDSAKALAISGLGVIGRDNYGVFPLKGKLLNVREASHQQIMKNEEVQNVAKILGLTFGKVYTDCSSLRYGHLLIMTDQDHDGSHIKGLIINFIHHFWPSLLKIDGFLQQFITPIVKCTKGKSEEHVFFTIPEYVNWKETHGGGKEWKIKYYKGLGTSTSQEAKEYFSNLPKHLLGFAWGGIDGRTTNDESNHVIELAFAKKYADLRKQWLLDMNPNCHINYNVSAVSYPTFVNEELVLFSHADNIRSIPHVMDGLKPSQRKVLFSCFKRNLKTEIKVAQLAGYVSEHSAYHHGEMSLTQTIIGMAQSFVGSNNINLLSPCGQFGTRLMGGKDAASPRYVFTKLESITRAIFHPDDDYLLKYLDEDGQTIEPEHYVPVIPLILVNGADGIGTGWSTSIPTYNPRNIISNLREMIAGEQHVRDMIPFFRGWEGNITRNEDNDANFIVSGTATATDDTIIISELPIGKWTNDYKQMLESMMIGNTTDGASTNSIVKDFKENHTDTTVHFTVRIPSDKMVGIRAEIGGIHKKFKLTGTVSTTNMHAFDPQGKITKYNDVSEIMNTFFHVRLDFYTKRKAFLVDKLTSEFEKLDNKVRFVAAVIGGTLTVSNRKKDDILADLQTRQFKPIYPDKAQTQYKDGDSNVQEDNATDDDLNFSTASSIAGGYEYLLGMKLWHLTTEKMNSMTAERDGKGSELARLRKQTVRSMWMADLDALEDALNKFDAAIELAREGENATHKATGGGTKRRAVDGAGTARKMKKV